MKVFVCISNEAAIVSVLEIDVDVSRQRAILIPNHGRAMREGDPRYLPQRNLCTGRGADEHASHLLDVIAEVSLVADIDGITFPAFDVLSDVLSTDSGGDCALHIADR